MSHATYLVGKDALFYSPETMAALKAGMVFRIPYRSNWRILHVDGFEDGIHPLPARIGRQIQFMLYSDPQRMLDYQDARDRGSL